MHHPLQVTISLYWHLVPLPETKTQNILRQEVVSALTLLRQSETRYLLADREAVSTFWDIKD